MSTSVPDRGGDRGGPVADRSAGPAPRPPVRWARIIGVTLTAVLVTAGLFLLGAVVVVWVALDSYGSNK